MYYESNPWNLLFIKIRKIFRAIEKKYRDVVQLHIDEYEDLSEVYESL